MMDRRQQDVVVAACRERKKKAMSSSSFRMLYCKSKLHGSWARMTINDDRAAELSKIISEEMLEAIDSLDDGMAEFQIKQLCRG